VNLRRLLALLGVALLAVGVAVALASSAGVGVAFMLVGVLMLVLAGEWQEVEAQYRALKLRITKAAPAVAPLESPRPEIRVVELEPTGGGTFVDFRALVQNIGTKPARMKVTARVGDRKIDASPETPDLLVNSPPTRVTIWVPRPELGDLMTECGHATTLYGETLHFRVDANGHHAEESWTEELYDSDTDRACHEVQQRYWRRGRGEETADDRRADARTEYETRIESGEAAKGRYEDARPTHAYASPNSHSQHSGQKTCSPPVPSDSTRHSSTGFSSSRGSRLHSEQRRGLARSSTIPKGLTGRSYNRH
jgi:hypothetical protein